LSSCIIIFMEYRKQAHVVYYTRYHIVVSTKYRRKVLKAGIGDYLQRKIKQISSFLPEMETLEVNTDLDHIHILVSIPPKFSVSKIVNMIKANTGSTMRKKFPFLDKVYWGVSGIWSTGYFVSTVGINEATIRKYVQLQGKEDSGQAKLEF
jgi:putative transposase